MSKIQKIDISNFGTYKNYTWGTTISNDYTFKNINIIYGRNYSGKTTLSRIFKCIENNVKRSAEVVSFSCKKVAN